MRGSALIDDQTYFLDRKRLHVVGVCFVDSGSGSTLAVLLHAHAVHSTVCAELMIGTFCGIDICESYESLGDVT